MNEETITLEEEPVVRGGSDWEEIEPKVKEMVDAEGSVRAAADAAILQQVAGDLEEYYKKSETYTKAEIDSRISAIPKFDVKPVEELPTADISTTTVYLLLDEDGKSGNLYTEYIYVNGAWEKLGTQDLDLTGYATTEAVQEVVSSETSARQSADQALQEAIDGKQNTLIAGENITIEGDVISAEGGGGGLGEDTTFWGRTASNGEVNGALTFKYGDTATNRIDTSGASGTTAILRIGKDTSTWIEVGSGIKMKSNSIAFVSVVSHNNNRIIGVGAGTADTDAINKKQLDDAIAALTARIEALEGNQENNN